MKKIYKDTVIIGGGTSGMNAYREVINNNKSAIIIEKNDFKTTCASVGCMPSKLLIALANRYKDINNSSDFGISISNTNIDTIKAFNRIRFERDRFVSFVKDAANNFNIDDKIIGYAKIKNRNEVIVNDLSIICETIIIATGSSIFIPKEFESIKDYILTNENIFEINKLPNKIAVVGMGVIALELGQALHNLGVKVSFFGKGNKVAFIEDKEINDYVLNDLKLSNNINLNANVIDNKVIEDKVQMKYEIDGKIKEESFDKILIAAGRIPNIKNIGLENLEIERDRNNIPIIDQINNSLSIPNIFIAGDAANIRPLLHEASDEGKIVGRNAAIYPSIKKIKRRTKIAIAFSNPEIMSVGLSKLEIENKFKENYKEGKVLFDNQGRSRVMLKNKGILKIYAEKSTNKILGAEMYGPSAEHIAHLLAWSIQSEATVDSLLDMPFYHPVIEEGVRTCLENIKHS